MAAKSVRNRASIGNFGFNLVATSLATVLPAALIPVADSVGNDLKPTVRAPLDTMVHWDRWEADSAATRT